MSVKRIALSPQLSEITPDIFTSGSAAVGIRGSGKTNVGVVAAEQAVAIGVPSVVVDPTGVWYGLKSSADGKSAGLPFYVFGGAHADVPLEADAGPVIARFVVENHVSIILDVSDLSKTKQRRFVGQFCEALFELKSRKRDPLFLLIDEVPRFCPQLSRGTDPDLTRCIGAVEDIMQLGRSRGFGCLIIGQRPASINKNVLTQADNIFVMRTVGAQDRKAIDEWVTEAQGDQAQRDTLVQDMPTFTLGEGVFWSPALFGVFRRVKFAARTTFDSSRTPKIGEKRIEPKAFAKVDLDALRGQIAESIERAKAHDPKVLRARIAELERELKARPTEPKIEKVVERIEVPVVPASEIDALLHAIGAAQATLIPKIDAIAESWHAAFDPIARRLDDVVQKASEGKVGIAPGDPAQGATLESRRRESAPRDAADKPATALPRSPRFSSAVDEGEKLTPAIQRIIEALGSLDPKPLSRKSIALFADASPTSGSFANNLARLNSHGYIQRNSDGTISLSDKGRAAVRGDLGLPSTTKELVALWLSKFPPAVSAILNALVVAYPQSMNREQIAGKTGASSTSGSFANNLARLSALGLIDRIGPGVLRANESLFPTGPL